MNEIEKSAKAFQKAISHRMRKTRTAKRLSLDKLAELTSLSKGYLSQIENCEKVPTINTLTKISFGLEIDIKTLITGEQIDASNERCSLVRTSDRERALDPRFDSSHVYESLTHKKRNRAMDGYIITLGPEQPSEYKVHEGEEFLFGLEGRFEIIYDGKSMILEPGDCLYFESNYPHSARSVDDKPAKVLVVFPRR